MLGCSSKSCFLALAWRCLLNVLSKITTRRGSWTGGGSVCRHSCRTWHQTRTLSAGACRGSKNVLLLFMNLTLISFPVKLSKSFCMWSVVWVLLTVWRTAGWACLHKIELQGLNNPVRWGDKCWLQALCETLEENNHHLRMELLENQREIDTLKKILEEKENYISFLVKKFR